MKKINRLWFVALGVFLAGTVATAPMASAQEKYPPAAPAPAGGTKAAEPKKADVPAMKTAESKKRPEAGESYVDIEGIGKDGKPVKLSAVMGKKTVVVFAQAACNTCVAEGDMVSGVLGEKKDVTVVFVMVDMGGPDSAKRFVDRLKLDSWAKVIYDPKFEAGPQYGFYVTPATVVIKDGVIVKTHQGFNPNDQELPKFLSTL